MAGDMKVAVVGLGFMGLTHLKAWQQIKDVEVAAIVSADPRVLAGDLSGIQGNLDTGSAPVDLTGVARLAEPMEAIGMEGVEVIDICLPTSMHADVAVAALGAGRHVLVEKPMGLDENDCRRMIEAARTYGRKLMCAQVLRFFPAYASLIDAVHGGGLGTVRHALFRRRCAAPKWSAWLSSKDVSGGGVFDLLIHDIDMAMVLFGQPEAVRATGYEELERGIDLLEATLHYPSGLTVAITGGWHLPSAYPFSMEYTVLGDRGVMEYSSAKPETPLIYAPEGEQRPADSGKDGYLAEVEYFVECVRSGAEPRRCTPESSAAAVALARLLDHARSKQGDLIPCQL
jgi:predicted dehydrogenase